MTGHRYRSYTRKYDRTSLQKFPKIQENMTLHRYRSYTRKYDRTSLQKLSKIQGNMTGYLKYNNFLCHKTFTVNGRHIRQTIPGVSHELLTSKLITAPTQKVRPKGLKTFPSH